MRSSFYGFRGNICLIKVDNRFCLQRLNKQNASACVVYRFEVQKTGDPGMKIPKCNKMELKRRK